MNPSRIEKAIDEIYDYVENCKPAKLAPNKVTVAKDELYDLLDALRMCAPEEIRTYQKIIHNRDQILAKANAEAEQIRSQAQQETAQLFNESELALSQADLFLNQAVKESDQVRTSALYYTSDLLSQAGRNIETSLKEMESKSTMLISALKQDIEVIKANRSELMSQIQGGSAQQPEQAQEESEETAE